MNVFETFANFTKLSSGGQNDTNWNCCLSKSL